MKIRGPYKLEKTRIGKQNCFKLIAPDESYYILGYEADQSSDYSSPEAEAEKWLNRMNGAYLLGYDAGYTKASTGE